MTFKIGDKVKQNGLYSGLPDVGIIKSVTGSEDTPVEEVQYGVDFGTPTKYPFIFKHNELELI